MAVAGSGESGYRRGNGLKCCECEPTLRVQPKLVLGMVIPYVEYVCRRCKRKGGLAIVEEEARVLWAE